MAVKRYKPTLKAKAATHKAVRADYERMTQACYDAIVEGYIRDIVLAFPYFATFTRGFPKGMLIEKTQTHNVYKTKIQKLLNWLHKHGYSKWSYKQIIALKLRANGQVSRVEQKLLDMMSPFGHNDDL